MSCVQGQGSLLSRVLGFSKCLWVLEMSLHPRQALAERVPVSSGKAAARDKRTMATDSRIHHGIKPSSNIRAKMSACLTGARHRLVTVLDNHIEENEVWI